MSKEKKYQKSSEKLISPFYKGHIIKMKRKPWNLDKIGSDMFFTTTQRYIKQTAWSGHPSEEKNKFCIDESE